MKYIIVIDKQPRTNPSTDKKEITFEIDELRKKGNVHDDFIIENGVAKVIRRIVITKYNVTSVLENEVVENLGDAKLPLFEGNNYIYVKDEYSNNLCAEYIIKSDFTDVYVTNLQMRSTIEQTAQNINLSVNKKLEEYSTTEEIQSAIEIKADSITSSVSSTYATKGELSTAKSEIEQTTDSITSTVSKKVGNNEIISKINQSAETVTIKANKLDLNGYVTVSDLKTAGKTTINGSNITTGTIDASKATITNINADNIKSGTISGRTISGVKIIGTSTIDLQASNGASVLRVIKNNDTSNMAYMSEDTIGINKGNDHIEIYCLGTGPNIDVYRSGAGGTSIRHTGITTPTLTQTSLKSKKKNIKKLKVNVLDLIKNSDICLYNLKGERTQSKKHIGLVIGDGYNCPEEVISEDGQGVEQYSMISLAWKAIQEQQKIIENLKQRIEKLEAK